jgi:hypothetical protein
MQHTHPCSEWFDFAEYYAFRVFLLIGFVSWLWRILKNEIKPLRSPQGCRQGDDLPEPSQDAGAPESELVVPRDSVSDTGHRTLTACSTPGCRARSLTGNRFGI